jgi:hypothetical protein
MKVADTIESYSAWFKEYGFDLWGEFGEANEIQYDDPWLEGYIQAGRVVSLVDYEADCSENCTDAGHAEDCDYVYGNNDFVMRGWAMVDVVRRVVLPKGWNA